jgi:hypothetical protein
MEGARKVVNRLLERALDDLDHYAYETALVVIYCRPFSGNESKTSDKIGDLPSKSRKAFDDLERKVHRRVLKDYRNRIFAHSDSDAHGVTIGIHKIEGTKFAWWPVVIAEESDVCHKGDRGPRVPSEGKRGREGKPWTTSHGFAVRMGRAPPAANGARAI